MAATSLSVAALNVYPVKSCRGIPLTEAVVGRMGIRYDRQWLIVDEHGMFVAQRGNGTGIGVPSLCLIRTTLTDTDLVLTAPGMPELRLPLGGIDGPSMAVRVWSSRVTGIDQGDAAAEWVSTFIARERPGHYRVVRMPDEGRRQATQGEATLAFADGYPFLILSEASLDDLNSRLDEPLPMNRFRPNIVLRGCEPYEEDRLDRIRIGDVVFDGMTLCLRCAITTTNQETGERSKEPLRTLATYRRHEDGVAFGRNFNHRGEGTIRLGDPVETGVHLANAG
ncbi:MAG TPA: MOSC N-terminal beta barrel domain-containing protein [Vicinamibacterales bacterium]